MKSRILLVVRWPVGGIRTYLRYVYRLFASSEWTFDAIATRTPETPYLKEDIGKSLTEIIECELNAVDIALAVRRQAQSGRYRLVHSHGLGASICSSIGLLGRRIPHIATLHDMFFPSHFSGLKGVAQRAAVRFMLRRIQLLHVISDDQYDNLRRFFPSECAALANRISVVKSGVEIERFRNVEPDSSLSDSKGKILGFFGRFMAPKGFGLLVDAIEKIRVMNPDRPMPIVVCVGSGGFLNREKRDIADRGLTQFFRFEPFVANPASLMKAMDGIAMPSKSEAVGLLAMESLLLGIPLLASRSIGLREVIQDTPTFSFEPNSSEALAVAILDWMDDDRAREFEEYVPIAAERFDVTHTQAGIQKIYERALD